MTQKAEAAKPAKALPAKTQPAKERLAKAKIAKALAAKRVLAAKKAFVVRGDRLTLAPSVETVALVKSGFSYEEVTTLARHVALTDTVVLATIGVTGGTVARRRKEEVLKPEESDRLYRLARVTEMAERVLEDPIKARDWLKTKNRALGGVTPFSLLDTEPGVDLVETTLNRIEYGVYG